MDWIEQRQADRGVVFSIRQRRFDALRNVAIFVAAAAVSVGVGLAIFSTSGRAGPSIFMGIFALFLFLIGAVFALIAAVGIIGALWVAATTSSRIEFSVRDGGIDILGTNAQIIKSLDFGDLSEIYVRNSNKNISTPVQTSFVGVGGVGMAAAATSNAASAVGNSVGQGVIAILNTSSAKLMANYRGKELTLVKRLSDDEASHLFRKVMDVTGQS